MAREVKNAMIIPMLQRFKKRSGMNRENALLAPLSRMAMFFDLCLQGMRVRSSTPALLLLCLMLTFMCTFKPTLSYGQIVVDEVLHTLDGDKPSMRQITLKNVGGKGPLAVKTEAVEVLNFGDGSVEQTVQSKDFFITPPFLRLGEGYNRQIKFIWNGRGALDHDRFFRLRFIPAMEEGGTAHSLPNDDEAIKAQVGVTYGTGILITVLPQNPNPSLKWQRTQDRIIFENDGNTLTLLTPIGCPPSLKCKKEATKRLLAGQKWHYSIPDGMKFEDIPFERTTMGEKVEITIGYNYGE